MPPVLPRSRPWKRPGERIGISTFERGACDQRGPGANRSRLIRRGENGRASSRPFPFCGSPCRPSVPSGVTPRTGPRDKALDRRTASRRSPSGNSSRAAGIKRENCTGVGAAARANSGPVVMRMTALTAWAVALCCPHCGLAGTGTVSEGGSDGNAGPRLRVDSLSSGFVAVELRRGAGQDIRCITCNSSALK